LPSKHFDRERGQPIPNRAWWGIFNMRITELAARRQENLDGGNNWKDYDEKRREEEFRMLIKIEDTLEKAPIITDADRLAAALVLLGSEDPPDFACNFKKTLYASFLKSLSRDKRLMKSAA
jgi:hypothetical protein